MAANPATLFGPNMTLLTGNTGGAVESLPQVNMVGGKDRNFIERITLASQANGSIIGVARIPIPAVLMGIMVLTSVTLGSSTLAFGDAGSGNTAIYGAAAALTTTLTPTWWAAAATFGAQINAGYDCVSGLVTGYASPQGGGAGYEDITMTIGGANLPASGTLVIITNYMID